MIYGLVDILVGTKFYTLRGEETKKKERKRGKKKNIQHQGFAGRHRPNY